MTALIQSAGEGSNMLPAFVSIPHPLVTDGREFSYETFVPGETLGRYVQRLGITIAKGALYVLHNGHRVPDQLWERLIPKAGDQIIVRARVEGSGGGSKVLRTVALVVVAIAAAYTGGAAGTAYAGLAGSTAAGASAVSAAVTAAVMIGGTLLVSPLIPEPTQ